MGSISSSALFTFPLNHTRPPSSSSARSLTWIIKNRDYTQRGGSDRCASKYRLTGGTDAQMLHKTTKDRQNRSCDDTQTADEMKVYDWIPLFLRDILCHTKMWKFSRRDNKFTFNNPPSSVLCLSFHAVSRFVEPLHNRF